MDRCPYRFAGRWKGTLQSNDGTRKEARGAALARHPRLRTEVCECMIVWSSWSLISPQYRSHFLFYLLIFYIWWFSGINFSNPDPFLLLICCSFFFTLHSGGPSGSTKLLSSLFGDQEQLIVYHMMMGKGSTSGCKLCSFFLDQFMGGLPHLLPRASFAVVAKTEYQHIQSFALSKEGWDPSLFYSSATSSFNEDFQVSFTKEQMSEGTTTYNFNRLWKFGPEAPGLSVFRIDKETGTIYHTYSTYAAGLGSLSSVLSLIDLTPEGRREKEMGKNMFWVQHKEAYDDGASTGSGSQKT